MVRLILVLVAAPLRNAGPHVSSWSYSRAMVDMGEPKLPRPREWLRLPRRCLLGCQMNFHQAAGDVPNNFYISQRKPTVPSSLTTFANELIQPVNGRIHSASLAWNQVPDKQFVLSVIGRTNCEPARTARALPSYAGPCPAVEPFTREFRPHRFRAGNKRITTADQRYSGR